MQQPTNCQNSHWFEQTITTDIVCDVTDVNTSWLHCRQWCGGVRMHRNTIPVNIFQPQRHSGSFLALEEKLCFLYHAAAKRTWNSSGGAYNAPQNPLVSWAWDIPPHPPSPQRLQHLILEPLAPQLRGPSNYKFLYLHHLPLLLLHSGS